MGREASGYVTASEYGTVRMRPSVLGLEVSEAGEGVGVESPEATAVPAAAVGVVEQEEVPAPAPQPVTTAVTVPAPIVPPAVTVSVATPPPTSSATSAADTRNARAGLLKTLEAWSAVGQYATNDRAVAEWLAKEDSLSIAKKLAAAQTEKVSFDVASLLRGDKKGGLNGVRHVLSLLPVEEKEEVLKWLAKS